MHEGLLFSTKTLPNIFAVSIILKLTEQEQEAYYGDLSTATYPELRQDYLLARRRFRKYTGRAPRHVRRPRHPFGHGRGSSGYSGGFGRGFGRGSGKGFGKGFGNSSALGPAVAQ